MSDGPFDTTAYETPDSDDTLAEVYEQNADNIAWEQTDTTMADTNSAELWDASLEADGQSWDAWRAGNEANANAEEARMAGDTDGYYAWKDTEYAANEWEGSATETAHDLDTASDTAYAAESSAYDSSYETAAATCVKNWLRHSGAAKCKHVVIARMSAAILGDFGDHDGFFAQTGEGLRAWKVVVVRPPDQ